MSELQIVMLPVDQVTPYENNARKHTQKDVDQIKASILADGYNDPIAVWGDRNIIIEGHGRLMAVKQLGYKEIPAIRLDHLTDEQRKEYAIRHNRAAEFSTWDFELLAQEMTELEMEGIDMTGLDFQLNRDQGTVPLDGDGVTEYGQEDFSDDKFQCTCPECGFRFNEK